MQTIDTVVVGAGPAGLAVGKELRERGVSFEILETQPATGLLREIGFEPRRAAADIADKRGLVGQARRASRSIGVVALCAVAAVSASCLVPPMRAEPAGHVAKAAAPPSSAASSEPSSPNWLKNSDFEDRDEPEWEGGQIVQPGHGSKQAMFIENAKPAWNRSEE